jgi:hypothetical protein
LQVFASGCAAHLITEIYAAFIRDADTILSEAQAWAASAEVSGHKRLETRQFRSIWNSARGAALS